jgi:hypothetical protein
MKPLYIVSAALFGVVLAVAPSVATPPQAPDGAALFAMRCTEACHQTPSGEHLSARQWTVVMRTMQTRMTQSGMAPMDDVEYNAILSYLQSKARR